MTDLIKNVFALSNALGIPVLPVIQETQDQTK